MSETTRSKAPKWFMVVAAVLLVWNLMGVMAYIMQVTMSPEVFAALPEAERQLYENTPTWATAASNTASSLARIDITSAAGRPACISETMVFMGRSMWVKNSYQPAHR